MADKNMFLYWGSGSAPCWKAMIVLEEKGLWKGIPNKFCEWSKGHHKTEEVLELNPRGQLPTFRDGDVVVNESSAICMYLEDRYSNEKNRLLPSDSADRAAVYQKIFECSNVIANIMSIIDYKFMVDIVSWDTVFLREGYNKANRELQIWENHLAGKNYLVGDNFTMADVFFYPYLAVIVRMGACLEKRYPALHRYHQALGERPSIKATQPPHWKDAPSQGLFYGLCDQQYM